MRVTIYSVSLFLNVPLRWSDLLAFSYSAREATGWVYRMRTFEFEQLGFKSR